MQDDSNWLRDIQYEQYRDTAEDPAFIEAISHVGHFNYLAETNFLGGWDEDKERRITFLLQRTLQEALADSGMHNQSMLEARRFRDGLEFAYTDPDYEFRYVIDGRGRIQLSRPASSARQFHDWYRRLMPMLTGMIVRTIEMIDDELTGFERDEPEREKSPYKKRPRVIRLERASFNFAVAVGLPSATDRTEDDVLLPNVQILNHSLLRRVPSQRGSLTDPSTISPHEFGKIDYQVNRWNDEERILEMYKVSAPSNNSWRILVFNFAFGGDTYVPSQGERKPFSQENFLTGTRTAEAYFEFFRQRCLCGFMRDVLLGGGAPEDDAANPKDLPPFSSIRGW
ncbi:unnamed protein product [[Actinomadura] parvosata subsp. kistnae]|uniref:Uncharacterized protein n=1 Tax=[Actinomadura] parvosata subsp. kistnae TaxID=1909395 RepID=A0A1U9ZSL9_9ACTN|nr:hypothetical protein [Nonomuraea sp. ATCC 55076]AQZ60931.1 hypothetical protein BKM31_04995 [Nonomuraea sp. ATCC 55076]SPL90390.1 unnamed protein product [Actinomadura parvosata subsp. kistnae]